MPRGSVYRHGCTSSRNGEQHECNAEEERGVNPSHFRYIDVPEADGQRLCATNIRYRLNRTRTDVILVIEEFEEETQCWAPRRSLFVPLAIAGELADTLTSAK